MRNLWQRMMAGLKRATPVEPPPMPMVEARKMPVVPGVATRWGAAKRWGPGLPTRRKRARKAARLARRITRRNRKHRKE